MMSNIQQSIEELDAVLHWRRKYNQAMRELEQQKRYVEINANSAHGKHMEGLRYRDERDALRDEVGQVKGEYDRAVNKVDALQQRLTAADERADERDGTCEWIREEDCGSWSSSCGITWTFQDDGPAENGMHFCHSCGKTLAVEETDSETEKDDDWRMNPCKQGHRDVGAAGGVAACNECDEKIEAPTTQEAFERWNATHPKQ